MGERLLDTILVEQNDKIGEYFVPIEDFLLFVSNETGWSQEQLLKDKDVGDVERKLNVRAKRPIDSKAIKRGKSSNGLYKFVSDEKREQTNNFINNLVVY